MGGVGGLGVGWGGGVWELGGVGMRIWIVGRW